MNIVHFTDTYYPLVNGVSFVVEQLAEKASTNNNVLIFAPSYTILSKLEKNGRITFKRIRSVPFPIYPGIHAAIPNLLGTYRLLKNFKPDVIHTHTPFVLGMLGTLFAQLLGVKLVSTYHTLFSQGAVYLSPKRLIPGSNLSREKSEEGLFSQIIWRLQIMFFNACDAVIAPTKIIATTLKQQGIRSKIAVLPGGLDTTKYTMKKEFVHNKRIIHLGRLAYEKATDSILKAFQLVLQEVPDATLVLAGDGPAKKSLQQLAKRLGIAKNVEFLGMIPHDKTPELYRSCELFTTASPFETQGLVLIEAMLSGLPVVAAAVNAPCDIVDHGKNGFLFKEGNEKECAGFLIKLLKEPQLVEKMGKTARKYGETFDSEKVSNDMISFYRKLITNRQS